MGHDRRPVRHRGDRHPVLPAVLHARNFGVRLGHRHRAADRRHPGDDLQPAAVPRARRRSNEQLGTQGYRLQRQASLADTASCFIICVIWIVPTIGLLVSSFRTPRGHPDLRLVDGASRIRTGSHTREIPIPEGSNARRAHDDRGRHGTFEEFRDGVETRGRQAPDLGRQQAHRHGSRSRSSSGP